jgi:carboxypeptidase C (cathepsin A)
MTMFREWSGTHFEFHRSPILLFCESYGGKMGAEFARALAADQASGRLDINFQ